MSLKEPAVFDFGDWNEFYGNALVYHNATRPNDQLVSHKIDTFRRFMSNDAVTYLGGFVRPHPRFDTVEGWDQWTIDVAQFLSLHDVYPWMGHARRNAKSADDVTATFAKGHLGVAAFWHGLDELVSSGVLSAAAQREIFWRALQENTRLEDTQEYLRTQCASFDPRHPVWHNPESAEAKLAEQMLSRVVSCETIAEKIAWLRYRAKVTAVLYPIFFAIYFLLTWDVFLSNWPGRSFGVFMAFVTCADQVTTRILAAELTAKAHELELPVRSLRVHGEFRCLIHLVLVRWGFHD